MLTTLYIITVLAALPAAMYAIASDYFDDTEDSTEFYQLTFGNLVARLLLCFIPLANLRLANDTVEAALDWIEKVLNVPVVRHKRGL